MRHLRRKRWIPSSKLCGISRNQTRWQVIKSCQLNVLSPVYLLHHVHADIIATHWYSKYPSMIVRLCKACRGSGMRMPFLLKSRCFTCHLVKDEFDQEDSIGPLFVCHVLDKVPFVLQICLLYGLPLSCENAQISCLNSNFNKDVASGNQAPTCWVGIMWAG